MNEINKGLMLIIAAEPDSRIEPSHDQISIGDHNSNQYSEYDRKNMKDWGWFEDEGSWSHFT